MQALPPGAMLSVRARASDLTLPAGVDLAAVNAPQLCVVSGPDADIDRYAAVLDKQGVTTSRLHTSHAFHSAMMDPIVDTFADLVRRVPLSAPKQSFVSSVTAKAITNAEATDPLYWARHVRATVRFADALTRVWGDDPDRVILEVGPRSVATVLARQTATDPKRQVALASLEGPPGSSSEWGAWLSAVGQLWALGTTIDWTMVNGQARRRRVPLPTYAWDHKPYWLDPVAETAVTDLSSMEQLVAEQLDLMARQLDILTNAGDA
jgi:acyl transferase domain-containing protein